MLMYIVALLCAAACLGQFAAAFSPDTSSEPILTAARRITAVAMGILAAYIGYEQYHYGTMHHGPMLWISFMLALGQNLFWIHSLYPKGELTRLEADLKRRVHEVTHT